MAKSSPEKLAKALRANLKKRKSKGRPVPKDEGSPKDGLGTAAPEAPVGHTESRPAPARPGPG
jgi:hypothetical protein